MFRGQGRHGAISREGCFVQGAVQYCSRKGRAPKHSSTSTRSWLAVSAQASREPGSQGARELGAGPAHKELKSEAVTVTKATAVARARAMWVGVGWREREEVIPNERSGSPA